MFFLRKKNLNFFGEDIYLLIYLVTIVLFFSIFLNFNYDFSSIFFSITSSISNIGISLNNIPNNLYFFFFVMVIIGGSFFSTSSGIRLLKLFSLIKFSLNEVLSYSKPNYVYTNKLTLLDTNVEIEDIYKYFLAVIIFLLSLFTIISLLTLSNIEFENSFKIGILTLMNTTSSSMYGLEGFSFNNLNYYSKIILIIFMTIGRVELISILIIAKKFLFKA